MKRITFVLSILLAIPILLRVGATHAQTPLEAFTKPNLVSSTTLIIITPKPAPAPPPAPVVTEFDNPQHCNEETQWIASEAPFYCIPKTTQPTAQSPSEPIKSSSSGNLYTWGNCTFYIKNLRPELPNNLGNADTWFYMAQADGLSVGYTPRIGAVAVAIYGMHVALVTGIHDGMIDVTEMNVLGLNVVSSNTYPTSAYRYIY